MFVLYDYEIEIAFRYFLTQAPQNMTEKEAKEISEKEGHCYAILSDDVGSFLRLNITSGFIHDYFRFIIRNKDKKILLINDCLSIE